MIKEKILGIDQLRPRLGQYIEEVEQGEVIIITSRSSPRGVLISYQAYEELKRLSERVKQAELKTALDEVRRKGETSGLSEKDVQAEIEEVRSCEP